MGHQQPARATLLIASACLLALSSGSAQAAGLFEFLFGPQPVPRSYQPEPAYAPDPLEMTIRPRRVRPAQRVETKPKLAKPIDPVQNPQWYLDDPTLRKGDIVVLKGRVIVYDGGRGARTEDDFTALGDSRLISKSLRSQVGRMAGLPPEPIASAKPPAPAKQAASKEVALRVAE